MPKLMKELIGQGKIKSGDSLYLNDYNSTYRIIVDRVHPTWVISRWFQSITMDTPELNPGSFAGTVIRINGRFV
jgi:hypothetical protein